MQNTIEILQNSGVILTPTDTTFGLSCLANDTVAIKKINAIKNRPHSKNFILIVDSDQRLQQMVDVPDMAWDLMDLSEKPISIIYDKLLKVPEHLVSDNGTIAIRVTDYLPLKKIIQDVKQPLVSTSANISGDKAPNTYQEISESIIASVDYVVPESEHFLPSFENSSIIEISHDNRIKVIRE